MLDGWMGYVNIEQNQTSLFVTTVSNEAIYTLLDLAWQHAESQLFSKNYCIVGMGPGFAEPTQILQHLGQDEQKWICEYELNSVSFCQV